MNRTTIVAVVAAAVVGIGGGTASAVLRDGASPGALPSYRSTPSASPSSHPSGTPSPAASPSGPATATPSADPTPPETNEPLLYVSGGVIHDGDGTTPFTRTGQVTQVARVADGFLVSTLVPSEDTTLDLWFVDVHGTSRRVAVVPRWDINADGDRVTAYDVDAGQVRVWELPTRKVVARYATEGDPRLTPAFAGQEVLISQDLGRYINLVRWDPRTGTSTIESAGFDDMSLSPGGSYLAGAVGPKGFSVGRTGGRNGCLHVESTFLRKPIVYWRTCDWRVLGDTTRFSPDGTRLLALSASTDAGPLELGIIDASDGPRTLVGSFRSPARTIGAQWADNDHLYLYGSNGTDPDRGGSWIRRCDLEGTCTVVARARTRVTLGSGT